MKRIVDQLVNNLEPAPARPAIAVFGIPLALAAVLPVSIVMLHFGIRPDIGEATARLPFWIKLAMPALLVTAAGFSLSRLSRPGAPSGPGLAVAILVMVALAVTGMISLAGLPGEMRLTALLGHSWQKCLVSVGAFGIPFLIVGFWALRRMAPVRLRLAGFALGLVAGGLAAGVYSLACSEDALAFIASWYQLGVLGVAGLAALVAPLAVRW